MVKSFTIFAVLLLAAGLGLAAGESAVAQPKEGCGVEITEGQRAAMEGSEDGSGAPTAGVGDPDMVTAEQRAAMEGSREGSGAPMPGRGECDEIDELPRAHEEG